MIVLSNNLLTTNHNIPINNTDHFIKRKRSLDDLLLPSLHFNSADDRIGLLSSHQESPYFFQFKRRAVTAPTSPKGYPLITPTTSPLLDKNKLTLNSPTLSQSHCFTTPTDTSYTTSLSSTNTKPSSVSLPPLKHLQLLPSPDIQEYSYQYPDTSDKTPYWRSKLIHWCKKTNSQDYGKMLDQISQTSKSLNILANVAYISSIISPKDQFYQLSNKSKEVMQMNALTSPVISDDKNDLNLPEFTPYISEKLVQSIKTKRLGKNSHKKSNSFKARELKKLLDSRNLLQSSEIGTIETSDNKVKKKNKNGKPKFKALPQQFVLRLNKQKNLASTSPGYKSIVTVNPIEISSQENSPVKSNSSPRRTSNQVRICISCHSSDSPCWRPSWSDNKHDQLCNSCGLRYKKTGARCLNNLCRKIPSKSELSLMRTNGLMNMSPNHDSKIKNLTCLFCGYIIEVRNVK